MNCGEHIDKVFANIDKLVKLFSDYRIVLYYDESTDDTYSKITDYASKYNVEILSDASYDRKGKFRTENIAHARNGIMKYVRENCATWEYMILINDDCILFAKGD